MGMGLKYDGMKRRKEVGGGGGGGGGKKGRDVT